MKARKVETDWVQIPKEFVKMNEFVTLMADVVFVNNLAFVITFGRVIRLFTVEFTSTQTAKQLTHNLIKIIQLYSRAGFIAKTILMDMKFDNVTPELPDVAVNVSTAKEHVAEIERRIRVVKEKTRATVSILP